MDQTIKGARYRRNSMTIEQKRELILHHQNHPEMSQISLRDFFNKKFNMIIGRSTISDLLKPRIVDKILNETNSFKMREKGSLHPNLEKELYDWFTEELSKQTHITNEMITWKAQEIGNKLKIKDFKYSNGWLIRFKKRYGINLSDNKKGKENLNTSNEPSEQCSTDGFSENNIPHQLVPNENSPISSDQSALELWADAIRKGKILGTGSLCTENESNTDTGDCSNHTNQTDMFNAVTIKPEKLEFDCEQLKVTNDDAMDSFNTLVSYFEQNRKSNDDFVVLSKIRCKLDEIIDQNCNFKNN